MHPPAERHQKTEIRLDSVGSEPSGWGSNLATGELCEVLFSLPQSG